MEEDWMQLLQRQNQLARVLETNQRTECYGLTLSEEEAGLILEERGRALKEQKRVEFCRRSLMSSATRRIWIRNIM